MPPTSAPASFRIAPASWSPPVQLAAGGMIIFLAYEGFELIANAAQDVRDAAKTLPRAYYIAVTFVIALYILVSLVTAGNLAVARIVAARDYALAGAGSSVSRPGRLHADRSGGHVIHSLGYQRNALRAPRA